MSRFTFTMFFICFAILALAQERYSFGFLLEPHVKSYSRANEKKELFFKYYSLLNLGSGLSSTLRINQQLKVRLDLVYCINSVKRTPTQFSGFSRVNEKLAAYDYFEIPVGLEVLMFDKEKWRISVVPKYINSIYVGLLDKPKPQQFYTSNDLWNVSHIPFKNHLSKLTLGLLIERKLTSYNYCVEPQIGFYLQDVHENGFPQNPVFIGLSIRAMKIFNKR